ncbi:MAG: hydrogenase maturation nickel metallochaperone HypA/HybF [Armatimonadota bacterium]
MHEFGIGQELVAAVVSELGRFTPPPRLQKVRVVVGGLRQVIPDNLLFAYEVLSRDTPAAGSVLEIETLPLRGECADCGWQGEITLPVFQCGACRAYAVRTLGGMELYLDSLEIEGEG